MANSNRWAFSTAKVFPQNDPREDSLKFST